MSPAEVIISVERRRQWNAQQKRAMVEEAEQPGNSISSVARKYEPQPALQMEEAYPGRRPRCRRIRKEPVVPLSEVRQLRSQIRELHRMLGKKTMEVEILKDAIEIAREKNSYCA